jgi:phage terminase large subunit-like protein
MGRPRLPVEEKLRRGTLRLHREFGAGIPDPLPLPGRAIPPRSYAAIAEAYMVGVESGAIVAGALVKKAVARQRRDRERAAVDASWPYVWDGDQAVDACHFLEQLPHVEGRWSTPFLVLEGFQVFLVSCLYGWRMRADPTRRRFTTLFLEVARKAAKSTLMAAIAYYHLLCESEPGASVICGATTGQQARMVFGIMQSQGRMSPWLRAHGVTIFSNSIVCGSGSAKPVNSKASSLDGLNPSLIILDESHAQDFGLHDVLKSAQGARANPLMVCPTTAGYDLLSVGYAMHQQVEKVLDGTFTADHVLGIIYTLDQDDDWRDPRVWIKANPMIGLSPKRDYIEKYCQDAQQTPGVEGEFRVKQCNQWMQSASRWLSMTAWDACADPTLTLDAFDGKRGWLGADLAAVDDIASVALLFEDGDRLVAFVYNYLPSGVIQVRARKVPYYQIWVDDGVLIPTDGTMTDLARIEGDIIGWAGRFRLDALVFDEWGSRQMVSNLVARNLPARIEPKNARTYTPPAADLEARVTHGRFRHDGNVLLKWAASNATVTRRIDGSILPKKEGPESPNKIDPIDALLQANMGRLLGQVEREKQYQVLIIGGRKA